jgi:hypothetical protein
MKLLALALLRYTYELFHRGVVLIWGATFAGAWLLCFVALPLGILALGILIIVYFMVDYEELLPTPDELFGPDAERKQLYALCYVAILGGCLWLVWHKLI